MVCRRTLVCPVLLPSIHQLPIKRTWMQSYICSGTAFARYKLNERMQLRAVARFCRGQALVPDARHPLLCLTHYPLTPDTSLVSRICELIACTAKRVRRLTHFGKDLGTLDSGGAVHTSTGTLLPLVLLLLLLLQQQLLPLLPLHTCPLPDDIRVCT